MALYIEVSDWERSELGTSMKHFETEAISPDTLGGVEFCSINMSSQGR